MTSDPIPGLVCIPPNSSATNRPLLVTGTAPGKVTFSDALTGKLIHQQQLGDPSTRVFRSYRLHQMRTFFSSTFGEATASSVFVCVRGGQSHWFSQGVIRLDVERPGHELGRYFGQHDSVVTDVACDVQRGLLFTAGLDGLLKVWDRDTYRCKQTLRPHSPARSLCCSQNSGLLAIGMCGKVELRDVRNLGRPLEIVSLHRRMKYILDMVPAPSDSFFAVSGGSGQLCALFGSRGKVQIGHRPGTDPDLVLAGSYHGCCLDVGSELAFASVFREEKGEEWKRVEFALSLSGLVGCLFSGKIRWRSGGILLFFAGTQAVLLE